MTTRTDLQIITDNLCKNYKLSPIKVEVKHTRRGWARRRTNKITIPYRAIEQGDIYSKYYIIHEVCHFITKQGHTKLFKETEMTILKEYSILPIYKRVYVKALSDLTGKTLWSRQ